MNYKEGRQAAPNIYFEACLLFYIEGSLHNRPFPRRSLRVTQQPGLP